jgi:hypothetical protein
MKQHELSTKIKSARYKSAVKGDKNAQSYRARMRCENGENVQLYTFLDYLAAEGLEMEIKPIQPKPVHDLKAVYISQIIQNRDLQLLIACEYGCDEDTVLKLIDNWEFRVRFGVLKTVAEYNELKLHDVCIGV